MSRITQKGATGPLAIQANGSFQVSADRNVATLVGSRWDLEDGREVSLVSVGAVSIVSSGVLVQDAAIVPNHQNLAVSVITPYSNNGNVPYQISVNLGATAVVANKYQGGYAIVNAGAGIGQALLIASHPAALSSGTLPIVFEDGPNVALATASSKICLLPPHGSNVIVNPTTPTGALVGVSLYPLTAGEVAGGTSATPNYGFVVSKGITSALSDAVVATVGQSVSPSLTIAGATTLSSGSPAILSIGYANQTAVSAESRSIFVNL